MVASSINVSHRGPVGADRIPILGRFLPRLSGTRQLLEFRQGFALGRVMLPEYGHEAITVRRLDKMKHLVNDHGLKEVLRESQLGGLG